MTLTDRGNESVRDKHTLFDLTDFVQAQEGKRIFSFYSVWCGYWKCPAQQCITACVRVCGWRRSSLGSMSVYCSTVDHPAGQLEAVGHAVTKCSPT